MKDPNQVLRDYAAAVRSGNAEAAWALLSEEAKRSTTFDVFRAEFLQDPRQARELADLMKRPVGPSLVAAKLGAPNNELVEMVQIGREEMSALSQAIEAGPEHGRLDVLGARATFDMGAGSTVKLLLENGAWHIENYRP